MSQQKLGGVALLLPGQRRSAQQRGEDAAAQAKHVAALDAIGADAVLIGETLMKAADKRQKLSELRGL